MKPSGAENRTSTYYAQGINPKGNIHHIHESMSAQLTEGRQQGVAMEPSSSHTSGHQRTRRGEA